MVVLVYLFEGWVRLDGFGKESVRWRVMWLRCVFCFSTLIYCFSKVICGKAAFGIGRQERAIE